MKKSLLIGFILVFNMTACQPLFRGEESTEEYRSSTNDTKINPCFSIAVMDNQKGLDFISFETYQADRNSKSLHYQLLTDTQNNNYMDCGLKISCNVNKTFWNNYEVNIRDIMGVGSTSVYKIEDNKIIPKSFTSGEQRCGLIKTK